VNLRIFLLVCLNFACFLSTYAQLTKVQTWYDSNKKLLKEEYFVLSSTPTVLDSLYTAYFQNGNIRIRGHYKSNKATGVWEYFYQSGSLKMKGTLRNNLNEGHWVFYYENGNLTMEGPMQAGKKTGKWFFYYENGGKKSAGEYAEDLKSGLWNYYYEDGKFKAQGNFLKDKGKYTEYYTSGKVKSEGTIEYGQSNGLWKYYYENGRLKAEGYEKNGQKSGMWKYYHENGALASQGAYENGQSVGQWKYFYDNGIISSEGEENNGQKDGYWKSYYRSGSFKGEGNFEQGEGLYKEYHENGKLKIEGYIKNNQNQGRWRYYYETGELEGECYFNTGDGNYTGYYPDGKLKMVGRIEDGKKVGIWELYKEDGSLSGYYKTYYEDEVPVFAPVEENIKDTVRTDSLLPYKKPEIKIPKKKSRYFARKINEFRGFIPSTNPLSPLFGSLPFSLEYYLQERLGYEINASWIRNPFFRQPYINEDLRKGISVHLRQKFYQPDQDKGMYYFGHEIRYSNVNHKVVYIDSVTANHEMKKIGASEQLYEYSILIGNRLMRDAHSYGYTFDIFVGVGIGYRSVKRHYDDRILDKKFDRLNFSNVSVPVRIGVHFGYALDKKKVYKKLGIW